jgi:dipeptidyl aminopeptidase/acylaminoacyl peptidase
LAVAREDGGRPRDIWTFDLGAAGLTSARADREDAGWRRLTHLHRAFDAIQLGPVCETRWTAPDGQPMQGLLVHPPSGEPPFPLVVQVHGGPANAWPWRCPMGWHDWGHLLAAQGFLVLLPNPRGSFGWGTAFTEANLGDMGGRDWLDILAGVDHLVARGLADATRLGIGGWSYGGFMTAWAVTQTDRFRAAVMGAGISNWVSFHGTADIPQWDRVFWQADPYERDGVYRRFSPVTHVANVKTPTLILHGEDDVIVPVSQAKEFHRALKDHGVETQLVTYPRQGHPIQEKKHQRDLLERVVEWYRRLMLEGREEADERGGG